MSGICGIINLDGKPVERGELERMAKRAAHRGRDGIHYHLEGGVGIACLSLDNTPDGTGRCTPVVAADRGAVFAADMRLDNREAFSELAPASANDGEVAFAALSRYGEKGPERLIGDFAYVLWDARRREIRLARDGMGMRSLYYRVEARRVIFATEIKQILAADKVPRELNEEALAWYLCGMQVPPGVIFYKGIEEVRPAEDVTVDRDGRVRQRIFWRPDPSVRLRYRHENEYVEHLRELLISAVHCRLRARSPVGISLSGGVDSGTIASMAGWLREQGEPAPVMNAYSWAFSEFPECDERENTYRIARRYGIPVTEIAAEDTWPLVNYSEHIPHEDDPYTVMYQSFMAKLMAACRKDNCSLLFMGVRGDVIAGDAIYDVPGMLREGLVVEAVRELVALKKGYQLSPAASLSRFLLRPVISNALPDRVAGLLRGRHRKRGYGKFAAEHVKESFLQRFGIPGNSPLSLESMNWSGVSRRQRYQSIFSPFVMRGVMELERSCSGYGLGFADPWSDRRMTEFALAVPQHMLNRMSMTKRMPRKALAGLMPDEAIAAASKVSPEPLYLKALRETSYHRVVALMTNSRSADLGCIDESAFRDRFERFVGHQEPVFDIWSTLSLEIWLRSYW